MNSRKPNTNNKTSSQKNVYFKNDTQMSYESSAFSGNFDSSSGGFGSGFGESSFQTGGSGFGSSSFGVDSNSGFGSSSFGSNPQENSSFGGSSFQTSFKSSNQGSGDSMESGFGKYAQTESSFLQPGSQFSSGFGEFQAKSFGNEPFSQKKDFRELNGGMNEFETKTEFKGFGTEIFTEKQETGVFGGESSTFGAFAKTSTFGDSGGSSSTGFSSVFGETSSQTLNDPFSRTTSISSIKETKKEEQGPSNWDKKPQKTLSDLTKKPTVIETKGIIKIFYELKIKEKEKCEKFFKKEYTDEDLRAFEAKSFEYGKIPEIEPPSKGKKPQVKYLNDVGAILQHENPKMTPEEIKRLSEQRYNGLDLETKRKYEIDV